MGVLDHVETLSLCEELLAIKSVSHEEQAIGDWLESRLREQPSHDVVRASNSLCFVTREPDPQKPTLMLCGHTDTVPEFSPNPVRREGDKLYGLGASDMKAADACLLHALERNREHASRYNLVGVLYATEETAFIESEMPLIYEAAKKWFDATDLVVCMEPTDNQIELGCLGTSHATVTFAGQRAHSARPWQGQNAIHKAHRLLAKLATTEREEHVFHGLSFYEVASATMIECRGAKNVVPDNLTINLNYRFAPGKDEAQVRARLDDLIGDDATYELIDFCPAGKVCGDNQLVEDLIAAHGSAEIRAKQAWTDVGRLSNLGVDAINWGCGATAQAHQAGEWVSIAAIAESLAVMERWLFR